MNDLRVTLGGGLGSILGRVGIDLEFLKSLGKLLVVLFESVNLGLASRDGVEKRSVSLLTGLESADEGLHVGDTGVRLDLLESLIDATAGVHLLVHLLLHEVVPELVDVQVVTHLELGGVLALVGGGFCDLLVFLLTLDPSLHGLLLVGDAALELKDSFLAVALLLLDVLHEAVEDILGL